MNPQRARLINHKEHGKGPVVYWMSRDQRVNDNWALLFAQDLAIQHKQPLVVLFCLVPDFLGATIRQYGFMLKGLAEVEKELKSKNIPFILLQGDPEYQVSKFLSDHNAGAVVTDFDPLRIKRIWKDRIERKIHMSMYEVDAHNIVPCWIASNKQEDGAYTIRPKINKVLNIFLDSFPKIRKHPIKFKEKIPEIGFRDIVAGLNVDRSVGEVDWLLPGEKEAAKNLKYFIDVKLAKYSEGRKDPNLDAQSDLSPYIHFGQISAQRVAMEVIRSRAPEECKQEFLEELIVRRELSDNYCFYNTDYDSLFGAPEWAKLTLGLHKKDERERAYSMQEFENARTHDDAWNAAQAEMVTKGKMHGYMRMYWAKKILEWTRTPDDAFKIAIYLNDKYELDGRDPNGYAGIAWSLAGVHDRAWGERPVFGKIRYMSYKSIKSEIDIEQYKKKL